MSLERHTAVLIFTEGTKDKRENKKITNRKNEKHNVLAFVGGQRSEILTISRRTTIIRRRRFRVEGQPRVHTDGGVRGFYFFLIFYSICCPGAASSPSRVSLFRLRP